MVRSLPAHDDDAIELFTPGRLSWVANVLFTVFIVSMVDAGFPLRLLDVSWQLNLISSVLNFAIFPLIGLGFFHLAADISPAANPLQQRRRFLSRIAVLVSFGFLLLSLLHPLLLWRQLTLVEQRQFTPLRSSEQVVTNIRSTLQRSRSTEEIYKNLQAIQAPPMPKQYSTLNLTELQTRMRADLVIAEQQLRSLRQQTQQTVLQGRKTFLGMLFRNGFLSLAFTLGFAALAQRRSSVMPLLQEWQMSFHQMNDWLLSMRKPSAGSIHNRMTNFIETINADEKDTHFQDGSAPQNSRLSPLQEWPGKISQGTTFLMPKPKPRRPQGSIHDEMSNYIDEIIAGEQDDPDHGPK